MNTLSYNFQQRLAIIEKNPESLVGFGRGVERETLRVQPNGALSKKTHPYAFGSALTHSTITTDYAESLLEFITPVAKDVDQLFDYLNDIHHYAATKLEHDEALWPISMPCFVDDEDDIELAQFGSSNVGLMKTTYRQGLKNRYGSMMQIIAGVHYNFSLPKDFWATWKTIHQSDLTGQEAQSTGYLGLVRNYLRYGWVIPYLFGASPAVCKSFLQNRESTLNFEHIGKGTIYLPYATSLRMSDLGYTSSSQAGLNISYNSLDEYRQTVRSALHKKTDEFANIGVKVDGKYNQLNDNILQIENELYSSIRPKRVQKNSETPLQALNNHGIEYIEVRSLDVNPFSNVGLTKEQVNFVDLFLTWCAIKDSDPLSNDDALKLKSNFNDIVVDGRNPALSLEIEGENKSIAQWGSFITDELKELAMIFDNSKKVERYTSAINHIAPRFSSPALTSSARVLSEIKENNTDNGPLALALSAKYKQELIDLPYQIYSEDYFDNARKESIEKQKQIEGADTQNFDDFLTQYFIDAEKQS